MSLVTLKKRAEFLRLRGGARWSTPALLIEGKRRLPPATGPVPETSRSAPSDWVRAPDLDGPARFGFTVTKKLGSAVVRNRIRRRLREIVRSISDKQGLRGCDYVIVARDAALRRETGELRADVEKALAQVNRKLAASRR